MSRPDGCDPIADAEYASALRQEREYFRPAAPAAEADLRARAERIVANWRVNFSSDDDCPLVNMIHAALVEQAAEAARLRATVARMSAELDDLAESRDPADRLIVRLLRRALDGEGTT